MPLVETSLSAKSQTPNSFYLDRFGFVWTMADVVFLQNQVQENTLSAIVVVFELVSFYIEIEIIYMDGSYIWPLIYTHLGSELLVSNLNTKTLYTKGATCSQRRTGSPMKDQVKDGECCSPLQDFYDITMHI